MFTDETDNPQANLRHYHERDYPHTVAVLRALLGGRDPLPAGFELAAQGVLVDWDVLACHSYLSTSESAVVELLRGMARLEGHGGGVPPSVQVPLGRALGHILAG